MPGKDVRIRVRRELYERARALGLDVKAIVERAIRKAIEAMEMARRLRRAREAQELPNGAGLWTPGTGRAVVGIDRVAPSGAGLPCSGRWSSGAPVGLRGAGGWWAGPDLNRGPPPRQGGVLPG